MNQFLDWLEGYAEALDGPPTAERWARILEKAKEAREPVKAAEPVIAPTIFPYYPQPYTTPTPLEPVKPYTLPQVWCQN